MLSAVIIDDVCLYDQRHKEMLRVGRLSAKIDMLPLAEGKISISSAQLFGAHARLYRRNATTVPNFQFVIDSLASKDTTSHTPLDLRISTLIIRHSSPAYPTTNRTSRYPINSHQPTLPYATSVPTSICVPSLTIRSTST